MMKNFSINDYKRVHFIGAGGVSMRALCIYLSLSGVKVSGSDFNLSEGFAKLKDYGVKVFLGHNESNVIGADLVVYTSAISSDNPELVYAKKNNIPVIKRSELLGEITKEYKNAIAISGSHGKTTTTAMLADIFILAGKNPTVFLGGDTSKYDNFLLGDNKDFIILEACEYKKNFLNITHTLGGVLNIDNDHADSYENTSDMIDAFSQFVKGGIAVINADDEKCNALFNSATITFGIKRPATFMAKNIKYNGRGYSFTLYAYSMKIGRVRLSIPGLHNVYNALASFAIAHNYQIDFKYIKCALENYSGVKRRWENLGKLDGLTVVADYAHHPSEIKATLSVARDQNLNALVVFQPHTYSRTRSLMNEFIDALKSLDGCVIYKTYSARENFDYLGSGELLAKNLSEFNNSVGYCSDDESLYSLINENRKHFNYDSVLFLGAGDIYELAIKLCNASRVRENSVKSAKS